MKREPAKATQVISPFAPFSNRAFLAYWSTGLLSYFGWNIQIVGASWLMTLIGGTPELVALVQTSVALPLLLFSLLAGALADIFGRRAIVLWSQAILILVSIALSICAYIGNITPWVLLAFTFLIGCCRALSLPGWQTYINQLMPRDELPAAVALNVVGFNIGRSLGPALGGLVVAAFGAFAAFAFNVVTNIGVFFSALTWSRGDKTDSLPPESVGAAIAAGIRYVSQSQVQTRILIRAVAFNFGASSMMSLMPLFASDLIGGGASTYGFLFGAFGAGAIGAAFIGNRFRSALSREGQAHAGFLLFATSLAATAVSNNIVLSMLCVALGGGAWLLVQSGLSADIQMASPRWVVSRCQAILHSVLFGSLALGSWVWGEMAGQIGLSGALLVSAVTVAAATLIGFLFPLRDFDALGLEPHDTMSLAATEIDVRPNSGPIVTTVRYSIRQEDRPAFLDLMSRRRRQRIRDGARRWTLAIDIQDPAIWIERFTLPTWTEVERHRSRCTVFGAKIDQDLRTLHKGGDGPTLRYELVRHPAIVAAGLPVATDQDPSNRS